MSERKEKLLEKAKERYGVTEVCSRAGYLLPNGEMLDYGDPYHKKRQGRLLDHSDVGLVFDDAKLEPLPSEVSRDSADNFMLETNSLRYGQYSKFIDIEKYINSDKITRKQWETIEYCCLLNPVDTITLDFYSSTKDGWKRANFTAESKKCEDIIAILKREILKMRKVFEE